MKNIDSKEIQNLELDLYGASPSEVGRILKKLTKKKYKFYKNN